MRLDGLERGKGTVYWPRRMHWELMEDMNSERVRKYRTIRKSRRIVLELCFCFPRGFEIYF